VDDVQLCYPNCNFSKYREKSDLQFGSVTVYQVNKGSKIYAKHLVGTPIYGGDWGVTTFSIALLKPTK